MRAESTRPGPHSHAQPVVIPSSDVNLGIYRHWLRTIGPLPTAVYLLLVLGVGFCSNFSTVWLNFWSTDSTRPAPQQEHTFAFWIGTYALLGIGVVLCVFSAGSLMLRTATRLAGTSLHHAAVDTVTRSSLRFLATTDVGRILNLFSQDMNILDTQMPRMVNNTCLCLAAAAGQAAVMAWAAPWLTLSYPVLALVLWAVQRIYIPTSGRLRLLDLEVKTPLYTDFLDTLAGLPTIRAFGWASRQVARSNALLDDSQRPLYLLAMVQQWLGLAMNMLVAIVAVILVSLATRLGAEAGSVGADLVSIITLSNSLTTAVVAYTGLETSLGAISRLKSFDEETELEDQGARGESYTPDEAWPARGRVQMANVEASYDVAKSGTKILKGLSLVVEAGEKLPICGRTGSGKSTVLALLLRLIDPINTIEQEGEPHRDGHITIEGLPLASVHRATLRERIITVPQEPVFLPTGTSWRTNLDPWAAASDAECLAALRAVHQSLPLLLPYTTTTTGTAATAEGSDAHLEREEEEAGEKGHPRGLDAPLDEARLSGGQRQLVGLARAVLRRRVKLRRTGVDGGLLLLDEVTSSADARAEEAVRRLLGAGGEFAAYTVVVVTHRGAMAAACDRVVVMEAGRVVAESRQRRATHRWTGGSN